MFNNGIYFKGDGKTRYKLSDFITENTTEIKLTNDERKHLLAIFDPKKQVHTDVLLLAAAFFTFIMGIIFCAVMKVIESLIGTIICVLPSIILLIAGIYMISTAPNIEKSIIKAYAFNVTDIMHKYLAYRSSNGGAHYHIKYITKITHEDAAKYGSFRVTGAEPHYLYLQLGEKWA